MLKSLMAAGGALAAVIAFAAAQPSAAAEPPPGKPAPAKAQQACFFTRDINGFSAADDRTVYVRVGVKQVFRRLHKSTFQRSNECMRR